MSCYLCSMIFPIYSSLPHISLSLAPSSLPPPSFPIYILYLFLTPLLPYLSFIIPSIPFFLPFYFLLPSLSPSLSPPPSLPTSLPVMLLLYIWGKHKVSSFPPAPTHNSGAFYYRGHSLFTPFHPGKLTLPVAVIPHRAMLAEG